MLDLIITDLQHALEHAIAEAKRWKTIANVLAERVRELNAAALGVVVPCGRAAHVAGFLPCHRELGHIGPCLHKAHSG